MRPIFLKNMDFCDFGVTDAEKWCPGLSPNLPPPMKILYSYFSSKNGNFLYCGYCEIMHSLCCTDPRGEILLVCALCVDLFLKDFWWLMFIFECETLRLLKSALFLAYLQFEVSNCHDFNSETFTWSLRVPHILRTCLKVICNHFQGLFLFTKSFL